MTGTEIFSRCYDSGNYTAAYDFQGPASQAIAEVSLPYPTGQEKGTWLMALVVCGFVLGFYSSYERHEVPEMDLELFDAALAFALTSGLDSGRDLTEGEKMAASTAMNHSAATGILAAAYVE